MINYSISIGGVDYTSSCAIPFKEQYVLDSALDNGTLTVWGIARATKFKPYTTITITRGTDTYHFDIFTDKITEIVGTGLYNHELVLIETTKELEKKVVDTNTTTQPIIHDYLKDIPYVWVTGEALQLYDTAYQSNSMKAVYSTTSVTFPTLREWKEQSQTFDTYMYWTILGTFSGSVKIYDVEDLSTPIYTYSIEDRTQSYTGWDTAITPTLSYNKAYKVEYYLSGLSIGGGVMGSMTDTFEIAIMETVNPRHNKSITYVVNRLLAITETLRQTDANGTAQTPALVFNTEQATLYNQVDASGEPIYPAPEFAMTKSTLRECLDQVGSYIHSIVRLEGNTIYFDKLGGTTATTLPEDYIGKYETLDSEQYASQLDTIVDNLVNIDDSAQGTLTEPFGAGFETVRANGTIRIGDGDDATSIIETEYPIEKIEKLIIGHIEVNGTDYYVGDITPYVYENAEYQALSGNTGAYPLSKAYALTYTQGQKNISGLTFKQPDAVSQIFKDQAIINIIERKLGKSVQSIFTIKKLTEIPFQVVYYPSVTARVKQSKDNLGEFEQELTSIYNQSANKVDSRAYGENLKGAIARLGNVEKFITFSIKDTNDLCEVGNYVIIDNEEYYIATLNIENLNDYIKVTAGLSKDFNALSKYIGIKNNIRLYEVSEKQSVERFVTYDDYCVIGDTITSDNLQLATKQAVGDITSQFKGVYDVYMTSSSPITLSFTDGGTAITIQCGAIYKVIGVSAGVSTDYINSYLQCTYLYDGVTLGLLPIKSPTEPIATAPINVTVARLKGYDLDNNALQQVDLSVFSLGIGNSIWLGCRYQDNYSAGNTSANPPALSGSTYYRIQNYVPYGDNWGELETLEVKMYNYISQVWTSTGEINLGNSLPQSTLTALALPKIDTNGNKLVIKKDSRENINLSYQCHFVTNQSGIVIGSQLAQGSPLVTNTTSSASLYILPNRINKFASDIDLTNATLVRNYLHDTDKITSDDTKITFANETANANGKSWALVDNTTHKLLFGKNITIGNGDTIEMPKMSFTHKVI